MKEKYVELIIQVLDFEMLDVITASLEFGDNVIEDNIFDIE